MRRLALLSLTAALLCGLAAAPNASANGMLIITRLVVNPQPPMPGQTAQLTVETTGGLDASYEWRVIDPSYEPSAVAVTSTVIESPTRARFTIDVPLGTQVGRYGLQAFIGSQVYGGAGLLIGTSEGTFHSIAPTRVLDTRVGQGFGRAVRDKEAVDIGVLGIGEVPPANVTAIVATLTAVEPTGGGYASVYPAGQPVPTVSNLNFPARAVVPNQVIVAPGAAGKIAIFNSGGSTHFLLDVVGYFASASGSYGSVYGTNNGGTWRVLDTRGVLPLAARSTTRFAINPTQGFGDRTAIIANLTTTRPAAAGYLTVYAAGAARPNTSVNNFAPGSSTAATATIATNAQGEIDIYNGSDGPVDLIIDVLAGWYRNYPDAYTFRPVATPFRAVDTRIMTGADIPTPRRIGTRELYYTAVQPANARPAQGSLLVGNITATGAEGPGWMNITHGGCCGDIAVRDSSIVNFEAGQTVANAMITSVSADSGLLIYNDASPVHAIVDVFGWIGPFTN